ncbi:MAG: ABC transporter permease [Halieaceae bacterium]
MSRVSKTAVLLRRMAALTRKESIQILRDPSSLVIAFVLPPILLFLFAFAVSLDVKHVPFAVVLEGNGVKAHSLAAAYSATPYLDVVPVRDRRIGRELLTRGVVDGFVVIPQDFDERVLNQVPGAAIQVITDGSKPNSANFTAAYAEGVFQIWLRGEAGAAVAPRIDQRQRVWFNPELESRRVLLPGAIAIVMTMIGTLLTSLVVAREWERGTMEALMSTPPSMLEIIISKLLPYFALGLIATLGCVLMAVFLFSVPLQGSLIAVLLLSSVFLVPALGQGLLISTLAKNQFVAAQAAIFSGFMPAFLLSGFIYEIDSMPTLVQWITQVVPARYFVSSLQTVFLTGDVWAQFRWDMFAMLCVGALFFSITLANSHKRLD